MGSPSIIAREMHPDELERGLTVRNGIFPPIAPPDWSRGEEKTAAIAMQGEEAIGFIPLYLRDIQLMPGVRIKAAFENSVGTLEAYRGQGVGAMMIEAAATFLKGKADAMFLYRGDERSAGYRFYTQTGHSDLMYIRTYVQAFGTDRSPGSFALPPGVTIDEGVQSVVAQQERLLELFEATYGSYGGFPARSPGYWSRAFGSTIYVARPTEFYFVQLREQGRLTAYAIVGKEPREGERGPLKLHEMASEAGCTDRARLVLDAVAGLGEWKGWTAFHLQISAAHPYAALLQELGYQARPRSSQMMARLHDPGALAGRIWRERLRLPDIRLKVWTPKQELTLLEGGDFPERTVTLEMKEEMLTRFLLGRLDLQARVKEGSVTVCDGTEAILGRVARAIPQADWVYHHLDYI
ncbi:GNAT family N-acetyltransferase [Paenibacillus cymbidii]|uniref:GNAT family N-acetyltransferase n=1 Tax=Paenibacillus cymbidii TaxID=1639034 RepID=UPI001436B195|nr:GNAT family N-acetyltransferase [Paenibacillus cymbidii]